MSMVKHRKLLVLPSILFIAVGCYHGKTPSKVSGKVTYKGAPVPAGTILFHAPGAEGNPGGIYFYPLNPDGSYSGTDLPDQEYIVTVDTEAANPKNKTDTSGYKGRGGKQQGGDGDAYAKKMREMGKVSDGPQIQGEYVKIPDKYRDPKKSPLKVKLTKGSNDFSPVLED
jgi:hypothetical protein